MDNAIEHPVSEPGQESNGNERAAIQAARTGVALANRSYWGRILVSDEDRIRFLHNQSTNDFNILKPGQGCDTVIVTSTARTIDLTTAYVTEDSVLLQVSPNRRQKIMQWLDRYIFFADKVQLKDVTDETAAFSLIGPKSDALIEQIGAGEMVGQPDASHKLFNINGEQVRVAVGNGLAIAGYTLILPIEMSSTLWNALTLADAVPMCDRAIEQLRIEQGRPAPDCELTEDYNPLEAGLLHAISYSKGCYIGQETIARLNTYKGVKQHLWGVRLNAIAPVGTVITVGEEKIGTLTSYADTEQGPFGLAYIRTKAGGAGLKVNLGEVKGEIVDVPFVTPASE